MPNERAILCGDVVSGSFPFEDKRPVRLRLWQPHQTVRLHIDDIRRYMLTGIPSPFLDLLEIATYVFCADQAVTRGGAGVDNFGENWRRRLFFRIPVRTPDLWSEPRLLDHLRVTLGFLSEDEYLFEFTPLRQAVPFQHYLEFSKEDASLGSPEEVVLFSGGLDSLAGAIQEAVLNRRKVALVTHRATPKLVRRHRRLQALLAEYAESAPPIHTSVRIEKKKALNREYTQRTRSFLYAALGATIAEMFGLSRIRFYENGIVSFNLPPSPQVVGARATRTTHPQVINGFQEILSAVAGKQFAVETPFLWRAKTDVVGLIAKAGCADAIKFTTSCIHTWEITKLHPHCGTCSQCIDRRFAVLSAGLGDADPGNGYKVDLLIGEREEGEPLAMLASYVETVRQMKNMLPTEFFAQYGEAARVLRHLDGSPDSTALKLFELHQRHARQVWNVVEAGITQHAPAIADRSLPPTCLVRLVCDSSGQPAFARGGAVRRRTTAAAASEPMADYAFRRKGQAWQVRFAGGEDFILLPSKGAAYLHFLLSKPQTAFPVTEVVFEVVKAPAKYALTSAGEGSDREALAAYRARYEELTEALQEARSNDDLGRQEKIQRDMEWLVQQIKHDQGLGGRLRREADDRERVRKSFRAAIRRVVAEIARYDKRFAEHLKSPRIRCGWNPCYDPYADIEWDT